MIDERFPLLPDILRNFIALSSDAVGVGYRGPHDQGAQLIYVNPAYGDLFGYTPEDILYGSVDVTHDPDSWDAFVAEVGPRFDSGETHFAAETRCVRKDGSKFWASLSFFVVADEATGGRYSAAVYRDISALKESEDRATRAVSEARRLLTERNRTLAELEAAQARLISSINAFPDPFTIFDRDKRLAVWNPAFARVLSNGAATLKPGMTVADILETGRRHYNPHENDGQIQHWLRTGLEPDADHAIEEFEIPGDRHYRVIRSRSDTGEHLALHVDITKVVRQRRALEQYSNELERANREISYKAFHDELTGLGNRRYLSEKLQEFSEIRARRGGDVAALHIDLDRFKQINDTIGHQAGDHVLIDVAQRLRAIAEPDDVIARIGGDEFVILIWMRDADDRPERLARELVSALARPAVFRGRECRFGASIGISRTPLVPEEELLATSDIALYRAKGAGRGHFAVFNTRDQEEMARIKSLADDIFRGIEAREFVPHYQAQVDAASGKIVGLEVLARWNHPTRGILSPREFIAVATDLHVVPAIDRMIFGAAIREACATFPEGGPLPDLSFNVSARRVLSDDLTEIGQLAGAYPGHVAFELLETIFFEEEEDAFFLRLDALREMGLSIEVDDFGSGRASVVALQRIGPDRLKIDGRLVAPLPESESAVKLVRALVDIGRALDIGVTVEGIETREQADMLAQMGCDRLQGYYFSQPGPLAELIDSWPEAPSSRRPELRRPRALPPRRHLHKP